MNDAGTAFECRACGSDHEPAAVRSRCPDCGGVIESGASPSGEGLPVESGARGPARYPSLLPMPADAVPDTAAGGTPTVSCPALADELGVATLALEPEGRNPTGSVRDREMAVAVGAAAANGAEHVIHPSTGAGARAAAAAAASAGLGSTAHVPSRAEFAAKAMTNVHGGEMRVVEGRYEAAAAAFAEADADGFPVDPASPFRRAGAASAFVELVADRDWTAPDHVVVPTAHGILPAAAGSAFESLAGYDRIDAAPAVHVAQPAGCDPVVAAVEADRAVDADGAPDTVVGPLAVGDPAVGDLAREAVVASGGSGVAVPDDDALAAAVEVARADGAAASAAGGVALAAARALVEDGAMGPEDDVAVLDPFDPTGSADLLRSHLVSRGE